jgi:uncharacterized protein
MNFIDEFYNLTKTPILIDNGYIYNDIVKFATDIGNTWGVGEYEKDNGIVVLICKPCRNIGIAVGTGIEDVLTDEICKEIIQKTMIPEFKTDNFYEGTFNGITALIEKF